MNKKPIEEGYKFFALCDAQTGFVYYFMPSGLREEKKGRLQKVHFLFLLFFFLSLSLSLFPSFSVCSSLSLSLFLALLAIITTLLMGLTLIVLTTLSEKTGKTLKSC